MREILFRGKTFNDKWVEGALVKWSKAHSIIRKYGSDTIGLYEYSVVPETVGQFVGLTDKNGNKIYEGDCFQTYCTGLPVYKHIVGYYPEHFAFMARCVEMNTIHYLSDYSPSAIKVIGNIHDNPELLEVEK